MIELLVVIIVLGLLVGLVVFDARRSCEVRLVREKGPVALDGLRLVALEGLDVHPAVEPAAGIV